MLLAFLAGYGFASLAAARRNVSDYPTWFRGAEATAASGVGGPSNLVALEPMDREWLEANVPFVGAN